MKKISLIALFSFLLVIGLNAQISEGDSRFKAIVGLNMAYPVGNDMEDYIDDLDDEIDDIDDYAGIDADGGVKLRFGMHFGFVMDYFIKDNIALNSGLIYSQKGFRENREIEGTVNGYTYTGWPYYNYYYYSNDIDQKLNITVKLNYIDIPICLKYATDEGFEVFGGIMLSILASDNVDVDADLDNSSMEEYYEDMDDYEDFTDEDPESSLSGYQLGFGYTFDEKYNISGKMQKTSNFGEIDDEDDNQNLTYQISFGIYF